MYWYTLAESSPATIRALVFSHSSVYVHVGSANSGMPAYARPIASAGAGFVVDEHFGHDPEDDAFGEAWMKIARADAVGAFDYR